MPTLRRGTADHRADVAFKGAIPVDEALPIAKQIAEALEPAPSQLIIVQNWFEELRRLVPTN